MDEHLPPPINLCKSLIQEFKLKAEHNKSESLTCVTLSIAGSLIAPFFLTLGDDIAKLVSLEHLSILITKITPAILSIAVAFSTTWFQIRKPQILWSIYRTAQRELENELYKFQYKCEPYKTNEDSGSEFIKKITEIRMKTHAAWVPLVPEKSHENKK